MADQAIVAALGQMGVAGILSLAVLRLFNIIIQLQSDYRQYLANQNALLREENKMLLLTLTRLIPGFAEEYSKNSSGTITQIERERITA